MNESTKKTTDESTQTITLLKERLAAALEAANRKLIKEEKVEEETRKRSKKLQLQAESDSDLKSQLESQVAILTTHLQESKRLNDVLLLAFQCNSSTQLPAHLTLAASASKDLSEPPQNSNCSLQSLNEVIETNRQLMSSMDKLESRCEALDEKVLRLKDYKRMVKNSSFLTCLSCSKPIVTRLFLGHIDSCEGSSHPANTTQQNAMSREQSVSQFFSKALLLIDNNLSPK